MKRSRSQSVRAVGGVVIALALPLFASSTSWASPIDQQRDRVAYYINKLDQFEEQAAIHAENLSVAIAELEQLEADLADAEVEVAAQESKVAETQRSLSDTVVRDFVGADPSSIGPLFSDASTINDNIRREQFAAAALNSGSVTSDALNRDQRSHPMRIAQSAATEGKRDQVESEIGRLEAKAIPSAGRGRSQLGQMIEEEQRLRRRAAERRRQTERQAAAAAAARQPASGRSMAGRGTAAVATARAATRKAVVATARAATPAVATATQRWWRRNSNPSSRRRRPAAAPSTPRDPDRRHIVFATANRIVVRLLRSHLVSVTRPASPQSGRSTPGAALPASEAASDHCSSIRRSARQVPSAAGR